MQALPLTQTHGWLGTSAPRPSARFGRLVGPVAAFLVTLSLLATLPSMPAAQTAADEPRPLPAPAPLIVDHHATRQP